MKKVTIELLKTYVKTYDHLTIITEDKLLKTLRQFNIRFKLALDIDIKFKGEIPITKEQSIRDLYSLLIKLLEIWNSYEALRHYSIEKGIASKSESIYKAYSQKKLKEFGCLEIFILTLDSFKDKFTKNESFRSDFRKYISRIETNTEISPNLKESCKSVLDYFEGAKTISGVEIIALVYAERNMYYHNGETATYGMTHQNRNELLTKLIDCFIEYILRLIIKILEEEIRKIRGVEIKF